MGKELTLDSLITDCPKDEVIGDNLIKAWAKINSTKYNKILCSISGGADSDIIMNICNKCDKDSKIEYVWFDTGLEYQATKDHLKYLEEKYDVKIRKAKAIKPIPVSCREYGIPFISKHVSDMISRLQKHLFRWEDEEFDVLVKRYCKWNEVRGKWVGCYSALQWWCNQNRTKRLNIEYNKWLREFLILYSPLNIKISHVCCKYAKKNVAHKFITSGEYDLNITGIRRAEGGQRATTYKNCFDEGIGGCDNYRPIFWYRNETKQKYDDHYKIKHSDCYEQYGLKRTGCAGCPFGREFEQELEVIKKYEPKLYKAVNNIFGKSYDYTRRYRSFCKTMEEDMEKDRSNKRIYKRSVFMEKSTGEQWIVTAQHRKGDIYLGQFQVDEVCYTIKNALHEKILSKSQLMNKDEYELIIDGKGVINK